MNTILELVRTDEEYAYVCEQVARAELLALDTETTGLHPYQGDVIRGISVAWCSEEAWYIPLSHPNSRNFDPAPFVSVLNLFSGGFNEGRLILHHSDFDLAVLEQLDGFELPPADSIWDTQAVQWLIHEGLPKGLKDVAARLWGEEERREKEALKEIRKGRPMGECTAEAKLELIEKYDIRVKDVPYDELPPEAQDKLLRARAAYRPWEEELNRRKEQIQADSRRDWPTFTAEDLGQYAALDANQTWRIYWWQQKYLARDRPDDPTPAIPRENRFQRVILDMIRTGIRVDTELVQRLRQETLDAIEVVEEKIDVPGINLRSADQVADLIYKRWQLPIQHRTRGGAPSTDKDALAELEGLHPNIELILEHRRLSKAVSAYYDPMLRYVDKHGRIHPAFQANGTKTGRLSCKEPNLQTIPRESTNADIRRCFVPAEGKELWEYDLANAELRIISSFAREPAMMQALENDEDLHTDTALEVFGSGFTDQDRQTAKNINYTAPYGGGPKPVARYMVKGTGQKIDKAVLFRAEQALHRWRQKNPRIYRLMNYLEAVVRRDGILPLHVEGIYRRFRSNGVMVPYYHALNAAVQGGIGQLMRDIMLIAADEGVDGTLCLQVHDSLVYEVTPGNGPKVQRQLQGILERINPFDITMRFDAKEWGK